MTSGPPPTPPLLDLWDSHLASWPGRSGFTAAVHACSERLGYSPADVSAQLRHVIARCRAGVMEELVRRERPEGAVAPETVLVLTSGGVPGLVLESIASALAVGARALVRPSTDECVLDQLLVDMPDALAEAIEIVGLVEPELPWGEAEAAIVHGTDETVAMVRGALDPRAAERLAAYGSRQGVAVVASSAAGGAARWATRLADDVLTFRQRGCMSPSWVFVLGDETDVMGELGRELAMGRDRHVLPGAGDGAAQRRSNDADILSAIAEGLAPDPRVLYSGDARLTVVPVGSTEELSLQLRGLGPLLQTAVLAASGAERDELELLLRTAGCTRVVAPGRAHFPDPYWPQDGIGRIAPLFGARRP